MNMDGGIDVSQRRRRENGSLSLSINERSEEKENVFCVMYIY